MRSHSPPILGEGCRGGVQIFRGQGLRSPHPYPSPEMGGEWLRQKTGRRFTSTNVWLIRCHLMYYCQRKSESVRVRPWQKECPSVPATAFFHLHHRLSPPSFSCFSTAIFVFLHRHFLPCGVRAPSYSSPRAVLLESIRQTTRVLSPSGLESSTRTPLPGLRIPCLRLSESSS